MKKTHILLGAMVLIVIGTSSYLIRDQQLQTQVLNQVPPIAEEITESDDCAKLSENAANECYQRLAIAEKDEALCQKMTKASMIKRCVREVELAP